METAMLLTALVLCCLWLALWRWRPEVPARTFDIRRPRQVVQLWERLEPGDRIIVRDKRHVRGERRTVLLGVSRGRLVCQTQPLARPFRRPFSDLVRLEAS